MKYPKFIIILVIIIFGLASCRNKQEPTEEELSGAIPQEYNYASGSLGYPVLLNGVGIEVLQAGLVAVEDTSNPNYVHIILTLTVTNESSDVVVPPGMTLVDNHKNIYVSWQEPLPYEDQLSPMPLSVTTGEGITGNLVFIVPLAATQDNLRLRWESEQHQSRIDVFLGPLGQRATP
ncbi:MAG: hypothetical protein IAF02_13275 [Anaerolineae bacterium]|nr:hypothetical protein [Anaerolineae bacterium]